jgi:hypothetical protein
MWEYLFFHFPIGETTFLCDVKRVPPATILSIDLETQKYLSKTYSNKFRKKDNLLDGKKALEYAYKVCKTHIPKYFSKSNINLCALTSGWDCRTNLSFCPTDIKVETYTYGKENCRDIKEAKQAAKKLNIPHHTISFEDEFIKSLKSLMFDTIYLSSGLEHLSRAILLYIYDKLTNHGQKYPIFISGILWDGEFRGHAGPAVISEDMASIFRTGDKKINEEYWRNIIGRDFRSFKQHIKEKINEIEMNYGNLQDPAALLSYEIYELAPKYYAGEMSIAKHFTNLRIPALDKHIIDLSFSIKFSTLSFSEYQLNYKRGSRDEKILQSYLIVTNGGNLQNIAIGGTSPRSIFINRLAGEVLKNKNLILEEIRNKILFKKHIKCEDWDTWINETYWDFVIDLIFSNDSRIHKYINVSESSKNEFKYNTDLLVKFLTIEILIRLIENKWLQFWKK